MDTKITISLAFLVGLAAGYYATRHFLASGKVI